MNLLSRFSQRETQYSKIACNGFSVVELLASLLIASLIANLCAMQTKSLMQAITWQPDDQEQFSILQLRELIALSKSATVKNGVLYLEREGKEESIGQDKNRLVKKPGYEIFMENVREVYFEQDNQKIEIVWVKNKRRQRFQVG